MQALVAAVQRIGGQKCTAGPPFPGAASARAQSRAPRAQLNVHSLVSLLGPLLTRDGGALDKTVDGAVLLMLFLLGFVECVGSVI